MKLKQKYRRFPAWLWGENSIKVQLGPLLFGAIYTDGRFFIHLLCVYGLSPKSQKLQAVLRVTVPYE